MKAAAIVALVLVVGSLLAHLLLSGPRLRRDPPRPHVVRDHAAGLRAAAGRRAPGARSRRPRVRVAAPPGPAARRAAPAQGPRRHLSAACSSSPPASWKSAEELLSRAAPDADSPSANYLVAARAADLLDAIDRRDEWLSRAQEDAPEARAAALVTLAEMQMRRGQDEAALQTLEQLDASGDLNSRGLELMARLCQQLGRNDRAARARRRACCSAKELPEQQVQRAARARAARGNPCGRRARTTSRRSRQTWSDLPRAVRKLPQSIVTYARAAMACKRSPERRARAARTHRRHRRRRGHPPLRRPRAARSAGAARARRGLAAQATRRIPTCSPPARGSCLRAELFGKARSYLEASLARRPNAGEQPDARRTARADGRARSGERLAAAGRCGQAVGRRLERAARAAAPALSRATLGQRGGAPAASGQRVRRVIERVEEQLLARQAVLRELLADRLDHRRRTARVDVEAGEVRMVREHGLVHEAAAA